jgi:hypothetical protein
MGNSRPISLLFVAVSASALASACGTYGDPCLRTTDCGSGFVCWEGKCVVDLGDSPPDGAPSVDVVVSGDSSVSDSPARDTSTTPDTSSDGPATPTTDSSSNSSDSGAPRDAPADGDSASLDATLQDGDARASSEPDASGADVGNDADSGLARDALVDAIDAAG